MHSVSTIGTEVELLNIVEQVVQVVKPLRVLLFGSFAAGQARPDSDADLLVIMPDGTDCRNTARHLYRVVKGNGMSKDFLVITESELETHADNIGLIYRRILREGKLVYDSESRVSGGLD